MNRVLSEQISKLEEEHIQLLRQRKTVLRSLAAIRKSQRYFKSQDDAASPSKAGQVIRKKRKLEDGTVQHEPVNHPAQHPAEKQKAQPAQQNLPSQIQQRFKRIMGNMSRHLQKAKSTLESEQDKAKRKAQLELEAIELQQRNVLIAKDQKRALLAKTKQTETKKKDELSKSLLQIQNCILEASYKAYLNQLDGFIVTKTQPPIYWKPVGKSQAITKLMAATKATQKGIQESVSKTIHSVKEPIQYRKPQVYIQNQADYLSNLSGQYHRKLINYMVTETKPPIFWLPVKLNSHLTQQLSKTQDYIKQRYDQLKETLVMPKIKQSSEEDVSDSEAQHD